MTPLQSLPRDPLITSSPPQMLVTRRLSQNGDLAVGERVKSDPGRQYTRRHKRGKL